MPLDMILSQFQSPSIHSAYFPEFQPKVIFSPPSQSSASPPKFLTYLLSPIWASYLAHHNLFDLGTVTALGVYKLWSYPLYNILNSSFTSSFMDPNIFLSILFSSTCIMYFLQGKRPGFPTTRYNRQNYI
jgi:hypothetical protein